MDLRHTRASGCTIWTALSNLSHTCGLILARFPYMCFAVVDPDPRMPPKRRCPEIMDTANPPMSKHDIYVIQKSEQVFARDQTARHIFDGGMLT